MYFAFQKKFLFVENVRYFSNHPSQATHTENVLFSKKKKSFFTSFSKVFSFPMTANPKHSSPNHGLYLACFVWFINARILKTWGANSVCSYNNVISKKKKSNLQQQNINYFVMPSSFVCKVGHNYCMCINLYTTLENKYKILCQNQ